jgi:hypothetical protein
MSWFQTNVDWLLVTMDDVLPTGRTTELIDVNVPESATLVIHHFTSSFPKTAGVPETVPETVPLQRLQ